ncbi:MAG TPA: murein biosynthesis integral membrane protein MurJ [Candidatus Eisenbacteria bacterium]|nr:murein biosynthesis integral membrane protein MurJ [Candidatus Eisenbacteria bacterium]
MVRKLFTKATGSVTAAAAVLGIASLASRLVGVLRDRLLSGTFGAGRELDAYYAAFRAPDLVYNLFVLGAITAGFIPVFTRYLAKKDVGDDGMNEEASELGSLLFTMLGAILLVVGVVGAATASWFVPALAPGFDAPGRELTVRLTRIMFLSPLFLGLSGVLGGMLQTRRRFFVYALAPIFYNLGIMAGIVLLSPSMGITGAAVGVTIGAFLHFLVQLIACRAMGWRYRFAWSGSHEGVRTVARMTGPRMASLAVSQLNVWVLTGIASTVGAGGIAVFNLANNLQSFPVGVIGVSFAVAAFPLISELAAKDDRKEFVAQLSKTVRTILFLVVPATVALLLLRAQIVRVVLGTGNFDWKDTIDTADTLAYFSLSLFAQALLPLFARAFFAFHDVKTPLILAASSVVLERTIAWMLVGRGMGTPGLALAFSIGSVANIAFLWVALRHRIGDLGEKAVLRTLALTSVAGVAMAAVIQGLKIAVAGVVDMRTFMGIFAQGAVAGVAGIGVYVVAAYLMGSEEARDVVRLYRRKFVPQPAEAQIGQEGETIIAE